MSLKNRSNLLAIDQGRGTPVANRSAHIHVYPKYLLRQSVEVMHRDWA